MGGERGGRWEGTMASLCAVLVPADEADSL